MTDDRIGNAIHFIYSCHSPRITQSLLQCQSDSPQLALNLKYHINTTPQHLLNQTRILADSAVIIARLYITLNICLVSFLFFR